MLKPTVKTYIEKIIRYIQLAFSLAVVSLYTQDLNKGHSEFAPSRARWVYAVVTGYISLATGALYSGWMDGWMPSFTLTSRTKAICRLPTTIYLPSYLYRT
jgi:hypothetical protein